jgi:mannan endo-1,4-beta-mannosidase
VAEKLGRFEAESGSLAGKVHKVSAGGNKNFSGDYVTGFEGDGDICTFNVTVKNEGFYDLTFRLRGIGGGKTNFISLDDEYIGDITIAGTELGDAVLSRIFLSKGDHKVTVSKSWGWIDLDYMDVVSAEPVDREMYMVSKQLSNKNASDNTKRLFSYLVDIYGDKILSGQVCDKGELGGEIQVIKNTTGKYPAILSMDLMEYTSSRPDGGANGKTMIYAKNWNEKGGILEFHWHWTLSQKYVKGNWYSSFYTESTTFDLAKAMNGQDPEGYEMLINDMRNMAEVLKTLNDADIPILFRPLHEASGGWFWWGASGAEAYKKLYKLMYEMYTYEYGLNNLIWLWNGQDASWYPGDEYCDILGIDIYPGEKVYTSQASKFFEVAGWSTANKPVYLSECGCIVDPELAVRDGAMWGEFCIWQGEFIKIGNYNKLSEQYNEAYMLQKAYTSDTVLTLDELPDLKSYPME